MADLSVVKNFKASCRDQFLSCVFSTRVHEHIKGRHCLKWFDIIMKHLLICIYHQQLPNKQKPSEHIRTNNISYPENKHQQRPTKTHHTKLPKISRQKGKGKGLLLQVHLLPGKTFLADLILHFLHLPRKSRRCRDVSGCGIASLSIITFFQNSTNLPTCQWEKVCMYRGRQSCDSPVTGWKIQHELHATAEEAKWSDN